MLTKIYQKYIPYSLRIIIYNAFLSKILYFIRNFKVLLKSKLSYFFWWFIPKTERNKAYAYMGKHGLTSYPFNHSLENQKISINVDFDSSLNLPYVIHNYKKLYFPNSFSNEKILKDYQSLIIEQDVHSSHRYVKSYDQLKGKTLLDIGSAEGIFALDTIEIVHQAYLFECESDWISALEATFSPWKEKVTIVKKYISDQTDESKITIDEYLKDKNKDNLFIKMDIEGAEQSAISGALNTLKTANNIHLAICTYHRKQDPVFISNLISSLGYKFEFTEGFIFWDRRLSKAVIRCYN